jgi:flagellar assembly factor FliW
MTMTNDLPTEAIVTFADGLPGFEGCRRFVLVRSAAMAPFTVVQGLDGAAPPVFVAIEPQLVERGYSSLVEAPDLARLGADAGAPLLWLALVASSPDGSATVNLRAPLVINPQSMRGIQIVAAESAYPLHYPLSAA